jgi:hypothetical protein
MISDIYNYAASVHIVNIFTYMLYLPYFLAIDTMRDETYHNHQYEKNSLNKSGY